MTGCWIEAARRRIGRDGVVVRASIVETRGSTPREAGAAMFVGPDDIEGSIGGGAFEFEVMRQARALIGAGARPWAREVARMTLGPDLGQCCGGFARVLIERFGPGEDDVLARLRGARRIRHPLVGDGPLADAGDAPGGLYESGGTGDGDAVQTGGAGRCWVAARCAAMRAIFVYGAGHVARELVPVLCRLGLDVNWVDISRERFPPDDADTESGATRIVASRPAMIASRAPDGAMHLVLTHDHALDLEICAALLSRGGVARLGLIGSATKAARFRARLGEAGVARGDLARLVCPVGMTGITGKAPMRVALSIASGVAVWQQELDAEQTRAVQTKTGEARTDKAGRVGAGPGARKPGIVKPEVAAQRERAG